MLDDASVRIDALSVSRLLAVAVLYVVTRVVLEGPECGARCAGIADAGEFVVGKGWLKWIDCVVLPLPPLLEWWLWGTLLL